MIRLHQNIQFAKWFLRETEPIYVYSQKFIRDTFYEADSLKGIFSLSKENKAAEEKIAEAD